MVWLTPTNLKENIMVIPFDKFKKLEEMIEHRGNKWYVMDSTGKKTLGEHSSKKEAVAQLQAIEINKRK